MNIYSENIIRKGILLISIIMVFALVSCFHSSDDSSSVDVVIIPLLPDVPASLDSVNAFTVKDRTVSLIEFMELTDSLQRQAYRAFIRVIWGWSEYVQAGNIYEIQLTDSCELSGQASAIWIDTDRDFYLSTGDTITVSFKDCSDLEYGPVSSITGTYIVRMMSKYEWVETVTSEIIDIVYNHEEDQQVMAYSLEARYKMTEQNSESQSSQDYSISDDSSEYIAMYIGSPEMSKEDLAVDYLFGCGVIYGRSSSRGHEKIIRGAQNINGIGVLSIDTGSDLLTFSLSQTDYPSSGEIDYTSGSSQCRGASAPEGVDTNGSTMTLVASDSDIITLSGFAADGTPYDEVTSW